MASPTPKSPKNILLGLTIQTNVLLSLVRYNGSLPGGDHGRKRSRFALFRRAKANGVKPSAVHILSNPHDSKVRILKGRCLNRHHLSSWGSPCAVWKTCVTFCFRRLTAGVSTASPSLSPGIRQWLWNTAMTTTPTCSRWAGRVNIDWNVNWPSFLESIVLVYRSYVL